MDWHIDARRLRAAGQSLQQIADKYGVCRERVRQVTVGVNCPVDHQAIARAKLAENMRDPVWREAHLVPRIPHVRNAREEFVRAHYKQDMTAREIAEALGTTRNAIIGTARDLGLGAPSKA